MALTMGRKEITLSCTKYNPAIDCATRFRTFFEDMGSVHHGAQALSEIVRWASTLMVQEGLEAEQADFVGRPHYQRGEGNGYRSGYKPGHLDTAEGRLEIDLPQVREAPPAVSLEPVRVAQGRF